MAEWQEIRDNCAIVEDDHVLIMNKPAGVSVVGERHETDLMQLAKAAGEWLMPAHRIDKVTSGVLLLAKNLEVHGKLARQFNRRTVEKAYLAITPTHNLPDLGVIDLPLSVGRKSRIRVASARENITFDAAKNSWSVAPSDVYTTVKTYPSVSYFAKVAETAEHTVLVVRPITGRRHQIRVHLAWIGHAIEGDPLFDKKAAAESSRTHLHSWQLSFDEDWNHGARRHCSAAPDDAFWAVLDGKHDAAKVLAKAEKALATIKSTS